MSVTSVKPPYHLPGALLLLVLIPMGASGSSCREALPPYADFAAAQARYFDAIFLGSAESTQWGQPVSVLGVWKGTVPPTVFFRYGQYRSPDPAVFSARGPRTNGAYNGGRVSNFCGAPKDDDLLAEVFNRYFGPIKPPTSDPGWQGIALFVGLSGALLLAASFGVFVLASFCTTESSSSGFRLRYIRTARFTAATAT